MVVEERIEFVNFSAENALIVVLLCKASRMDVEKCGLENWSCWQKDYIPVDSIECLASMSWTTGSSA